MQNQLKKPSFKFILSFLGLIFSSFLVSFLITNWYLLKIPKSERVLTEIPFDEENMAYENFILEENMLRIDREEASIRIELEDRYVEKLNIAHKVENNIDVGIVLTKQNTYGDIIETKESERLMPVLNVSTLPIRNDIKSIELKFKEGELEIKSISIDNRIKFNSYIFLTIIVTGAVLLTILLWKEQLFRKTENIFLLLATSMGILFLFLFPNRVGVSWDEHIHFQNIYTLSNTPSINWTESSWFLVEKVVSNNFSLFNTPEERTQLNNYLNSSHDYSNTVFSETKTLAWTPHRLIYLPFVIGFKISDLIGLPFTVSLLISRLTNLFVYIVAIYFAIKNIPIFKKGLTCIVLLPGCIFLASHFSYDGLIIAFSFLAIAFLAKMILSKEKDIPNKDLIIFTISTLIASSSKGVYAFLLLIPLFIPKEKYKNLNQKKWFHITLMVSFFLVISSFLLPRASNPESFGDPRGGNTNPLEQVLFIKTHPISFMKIFIEHTISNFFNTNMSLNAIVNFAYAGSASSNLFYLALFSLMFFTLTDTYKQNQKDHIPIKIKTLLFFIAIAIIYSIWLILYLEFSPIGSTTINGVQSRYFLPVLPLLLLIINSYKIKTKIPENKYNKILLISSFLLLCASVISVALKVYCI